MKMTAKQQSLRRLAATLTTATILPLTVLAPAYLASVLITSDTPSANEATERVSKIDIAEISPDGTFAYNVDSPLSDSAANESEQSPAELLHGSDHIEISYSSGHEIEVNDECGLTLMFGSHDRYDAETETYVSHLRVQDDKSGSDRLSAELVNCSVLFLEIE